MSFIQEFKAFAMRGNVVDLAVGVVIGAAFGKIVSAMVDNIFMPVLGVLTSGINFKDLGFTLKAANPVTNTPAVVIGYGAFIQALIDFTIVAFAIFLVVKAMNRFMPRPNPPPKGPSQEELLTQIRDLLKKQAKK
jgi:large conductance mechanosensitive channel